MTIVKCREGEENQRAEWCERDPRFQLQYRDKQTKPTKVQMNKKLMEFVCFSAWISSSGGSLTKLPQMAPSGWSKYGLSRHPGCRSQELCEGRVGQCGAVAGQCSVRPQLNLSPLEPHRPCNHTAPCVPGIYVRAGLLCVCLQKCDCHLGQDSVSGSHPFCLRLIYRPQSHWGKALLGFSRAPARERC